MFDVKEAIKAQEKLCIEKGYPHFAPYDGVCYRCGKNIYKPIEKGKYIRGITVERAGSELITGCPHCKYSYCE